MREIVFVIRVCGSKRLRRDVAVEVRAIKMDLLHGGIRGGLGGSQILAEGGLMQPSAVGAAYL